MQSDFNHLVGYNAKLSATVVGQWQNVAEWSMGGNDKYGDCCFVSLCNLQDLASAVEGKPFVIGEAEAELFYSREANFDPENSQSDQGAILEDVIQYWCDNGWPSDPTDKPTGWCEITVAQIPMAVDKLYGVPATCLLPMTSVDDDFKLFNDTTLHNNPSDGHAILIVGAGPDGYTIVTWAKTINVSYAWWRKFGRKQYAIKLAST